MKKCFAFVIPLIIGVNLAFAQDGMKTTQLNVFKNGTYFIVKEGVVPVKNYVAKLEIPKNPLLGTFWLTSTREVNINKVVFMVDTLKVSQPARTITDLLKVNKGKKVRLMYRLDEKNYGEISGLLVDFFQQSSLVKLKTGDGKFAYLPATDIRQLFIDEAPVESMKNDSVSYMAKVEFNKNPEDTRLKLVYMQTGIQWIPGYNIKVLNDKELQLEMRALIENFVEPVKDAELTLTVGDPNYRYGRTIEFFVNPYLTNLSGSPSAGSRTYMFQNTSVAKAESMDAMAAPDPGYNEYQVYETEGEKTNDLYMYELGKVSLPKNSKTSFQIFSQKIPYRDMFKVTISDVVNYGGNLYINNDPERKFDVFHSIKLTNATKTPFTTAPVFVMDEELRPLAQDEIKYTAVGDNVSVQLSKSIDIIVRNTENESGREDRAKVIDKNTYNKITIKGSIPLQNTLDKKVNLNIEKTVNALITEASDKGNIRKPPRYSGLNPTSVVEWEISLEPGEKKTVTYVYEVYVNARY